jgi:hypothetical protein
MRRLLTLLALAACLLTAARVRAFAQAAGGCSPLAGANCDAVFVASVPADRSACNDLASRLAEDTARAEAAQLLSASMRIRQGVTRDSFAARAVSPAFIWLRIVNESGGPLAPAPAVANARSCAASVAQTLVSLPSNGTLARLLPDLGAASSTTAFVQALIGVGLVVDSVKFDATLADISRLLALGRVPVVRIAACRASAATPWPNVFGAADAERFAVVVGLDTTLVYLALPGLVAAPLAISRREFLTRWHHLEALGAGRWWPRQRWLAGAYAAAAGDRASVFSGVPLMLSAPPLVVDFDGTCS